MPRPRNPNPTRSALRMRAKRGDEEAAEALRMRKDARLHMGVDIARPGGDVTVAVAMKRTETGRLVLVGVWIPKGDEKAIEFAAQRLRKAARVP